MMVVLAVLVLLQTEARRTKQLETKQLSMVQRRWIKHAEPEQRLSLGNAKMCISFFSITRHSSSSIYQFQDPSLFDWIYFEFFMPPGDTMRMKEIN